MTGQCRICGCTAMNCSQCIERDPDGEPCHWIAPDLCSACAPTALKIDALAMLVRRLASRLPEDHLTRKDALAYLKANDLMGSPLRTVDDRPPDRGAFRLVFRYLLGGPESFLYIDDPAHASRHVAADQIIRIERVADLQPDAAISPKQRAAAKRLIDACREQLDAEQKGGLRAPVVPPKRNAKRGER